MTLRTEYLAQHGSEEDAAVALALDLMRGDPQTFKAGYTLENAAIAASEVFATDRATIEGRLRDGAAC